MSWSVDKMVGLHVGMLKDLAEEASSIISE